MRCTQNVSQWFRCDGNITCSTCPQHLVIKVSKAAGHHVLVSNLRLNLSVCLVQGDGARTSITLDFGDGHALTYSNVSSLEDGIKHIYKTVGIYWVTATGENSLGSESATLYLHVTCELL